MDWVAPSATDFKNVFTRDFPFAPEEDPTNLDFVTDADINRAVSEAQLMFNPCLFGASATQIFMFLAAHHLVINLQSSAKGLSAQAKFAIESTSVGGVSTSFSIPQVFKDDPMFSGLMTTAYGLKYLNLVYPYTIGQVGTVGGGTLYD